jgi:hypothetical protein
MEDVGSISVHHHAMAIALVKCITSDVLSLVDNRDPHPGRGAPLCDYAASESSSHNKNIDFHSNRPHA